MKQKEQAILNPINFSTTDQMLETLLKISSSFNTLLKKDEILRQFSMYLMGQFAIKNFALYSLNSDENSYTLLKKENFETLADTINIKSLNFTENRILLAKTPGDKAIFKSQNTNFIAQLTDNKGVLLIGNRMINKEFSELDFSFMISISDLALFALDNVRLIQAEQEKMLLDKELNLALKIQQNLLPKYNLQLKSYEIVGKSKAHKFVGGDYYDFIKIDENRYLIIIADVCGKNIPAAMIMSNLQSALKTQLLFITDLRQIISNLNKIIYENTETNIFITLFLGILDIQTNEFTYINAGHIPPMFYKNNSGRISQLDIGGIVVGIFQELPFEYLQAKIKFAENDILVLFTDGISEATNISGDILGEDTLAKHIKNNIDLSAARLLEFIISEVENYQIEQNDDITIVVIKRNCDKK